MEPLPLRDIHLPEVTHGWPPAIGWWLLAILLPLAIAAAIYLYKRIRRQSALKTAGKMLAALRRGHDRDALRTLGELSVLLRRVAISTSPRAEVAGLKGEDWLAYLDGPFPDTPFRRGVGRILADAQYRKTAPEDVDFEALFTLCERWLKRQGSTKARTPTRQGRRIASRLTPNPAHESEK